MELSEIVKDLWIFSKKSFKDMIDSVLETFLQAFFLSEVMSNRQHF